MEKLSILLFLVLQGCSLAPALTTNIKRTYKIGKTNYKCKFRLTYNESMVDLSTSSMKCRPRKLKKKTLDVTLITKDYTFMGTIRPPRKIVSMDIFKNTTTIKPNTISLEEAKFQEIYKNISSNIQADSKSHSHISCSFDEMEAKLMMSKSYQGTTELWANGEVKWNFVSIGSDDLDIYDATTDFDLGLNWNDVFTVMEAMKQIESKTCIRFKYFHPTEETKDEPWLFISRESRSTDGSCMTEKVKSLANTNIDNLGTIYNRMQFVDSCSGGAYAWKGAASPQNLVISFKLGHSASLDPKNQNDIGLVVHELLHNLGLDHTQKRKDASSYINVNYENIDESHWYAYKPCGDVGSWCFHYDDYGTPYDCSSIMHYWDTAWITPEAAALGLKTMTPKIANCDLGYKSKKLSDGDILLLNNMYCPP